MELLAPAGNAEKSRIALRFGADAIYFGIPGFSLRAGAEQPLNPEHLRALKQRFPRRRIYGALNRYIHQNELRNLAATLEMLQDLPVDALILSDIGLIESVRSALPAIELHLSTQANCTNAAAARLYRDLGFSRIVPARELTLDEVREIHHAVPELEIELFVHGAMCMAYSGRCFLSAEMTGRSANAGDCAHSCRWHYAVVEEKRPGEYYPLEQDEQYLAIFSSRDLMLIDHLEEIRQAGVAAVKIEGRMKSALYTAISTRAYRAALDGEAIAGRWRRELFNLPHRAYTTGFLKEDPAVHDAAHGSSGAQYRLMGIVGAPLDGRRERAGYRLTVKNTLTRHDLVDILLPDGTITTVAGLDLRDEAGMPVAQVVQGKPAHLLPPPETGGRDLADGIIRFRHPHRSENVASER